MINKSHIDKWIILFTGILMSIFILAGCGVNEKENNIYSNTELVSDNNSDDKQSLKSILNGKRIKFLTSQGKYHSEYQVMSDEMYKEYGCDVEFQIIPDNEYASFVKLKLMTTEAPDIFEYNYPMQNSELDVAEYCLDLSAEPWVDRLKDPSTCRDMEDKKIYALPCEKTECFSAVFYNKTALENCGITDPHPETYEEFLDILGIVKGRGKGTIPFYETNADEWTTQLFISAGFSVALGEKGGTVFSSIEKGKEKFTTVPEFTDVLTNYCELIRQGYVNSYHVSTKYETAIDAIGSGEAAMYFTTDKTAAAIAAKYPECKIGAFALPFNDNDFIAEGSFSQGLFVPKEGDQIEVTRAFLQAWSTPDIQNIYFSSQKVASPFVDVDQKEPITSVKKLIKEYKTGNKYVVQMNDQLYEYSSVLENHWGDIVKMLSWSETPYEVLRGIQTELDSYRKTVMSK